MRVISALAAMTVGFAVTLPVLAETDPECIHHLGGAFADVECFNGLANDLKKQNIKLAAQVEQTMPRGNPNRRRLEQYLAGYQRIAANCAIAREAMDGWHYVPNIGGARYHSSDTLYYQCLYDLQKAQNTFLSDLLANTNP